MTLLALTLSVGFVVDDAIVMLENIVRHIEGGIQPFEAALKGAARSASRSSRSPFSLVAVFIPVLLMGGVVGRVFREFAVTIAVAIVVSGFVSLTLTPMLCARIFAASRGEKQNIVLRIFEAVFDRGCAATSGRSTGYSPTSPHARLHVRAPWRSRSSSISSVPKGFFPIEDTGLSRSREGRRHLLQSDGRAPARDRRDRAARPGR